MKMSQTTLNPTIRPLFPYSEIQLSFHLECILQCIGNLTQDNYSPWKQVTLPKKTIKFDLNESMKDFFQDLWVHFVAILWNDDPIL